MTRRVDLLVVGAGPAGMSAAIIARQHGLNVLVVDEQPVPGGQIWRNVEAVVGTRRAAVLGASYTDGLAVVEKFRASGAAYEPGTQVWQVESGPRAFTTRDGKAACIDADFLVLATGAQERPMPFPGWTLPGVMTVGAAQILLKTSGQVPDAPLWIAGSGPLTLLYAAQLLSAGGRIAGFLDTTPPGRTAHSLGKLGTAVWNAPGDLMKGLGWLWALRRQVHYVRHVSELHALGGDALERVRYTTARGRTTTVDARVLLVHEGVVPNIHPTLALGCRHVWRPDQDSFAPELDVWGETSESNVFVAGDGGGIGGAAAACHRGEAAALRIVSLAGRLSAASAAARAKSVRRRLGRSLASRPFLDAAFRPRSSIFLPSNETMACRCEEVQVGSIREAAGCGQPGPDQIKAQTRAGMGPCQGRQCSYTVANILAHSGGTGVPDLGLYRVRPPLKPITLGELAALQVSGAVQ